MKALIILRGCPGAGKSTWVKENHLEAYTLCPDDIRVMCASRELKADSTFAIARNSAVEQETWKIILDLLEYRMSRGELTILDATASKTKDIKQYKKLAEQYRYRMYCVDFTNVPLEVCKKQNLMRSEDKIVPEEGIDNIYARFATQSVPSGVEIIKPNELYKILEKPIDLSSYKKIVFVGDIHGCYDTLMQYSDFKEGLKDDTEYIFLGDYVDRGNQNAEVLHFLNSIKDKPNVCLLEGNHERWIRDYGNDVPAKSAEFETKTKAQLIVGNFSQKDARNFYRKLRQMSHFTYNGLEVLACHGGIPCMRTNLIYTPACTFINGAGDYKDYQLVADTWTAETKANQYLVHGHRNTQNDPVQVADRVFNLEGEVEFGGKLRIVELEMQHFGIEYGIIENGDRVPVGAITAPKWNVVEIENCQPITEEDKENGKVDVETIHDAITYLRANKFVQEKRLTNGISSFNFTREAFYSANWNRQTILARGLFIDTENEKIMARSYEKFFRINEVHATEMINLKSTLKFPVKAYVKENGFLGIVSYNYKTDDLFIATKSSDKGDYAEYFKKLLEPYREKLLENLRTTASPQSFIFEVIDKDNDPHIIKYAENKIVLLDVIFNDLRFATIPYEHLKEEAAWLGCPAKELAYTIKDYDEFRDLVHSADDEEFKYNGNYIEGFVFVDQNGFMTKLKTGYYNFWKHMRGVAEATLRSSYYSKTGSLLTPEANKFYAFCKDCFNNDRIKETKSYPYKIDIISLREKYLEELK